MEKPLPPVFVMLAESPFYPWTTVGLQTTLYSQLPAPCERARGTCPTRVVNIHGSIVA